MTDGTALQQLKEREAAVTAQRLARFNDLAEDVFGGILPDIDEASTILREAGKSAGDLENAVDAIQQRRACLEAIREDVDEYERLLMLCEARGAAHERLTSKILDLLTKAEAVDAEWQEALKAFRRGASARRERVERFKAENPELRDAFQLRETMLATVLELIADRHVFKDVRDTLEKDHQRGYGAAGIEKIRKRAQAVIADTLQAER